ncbi:MAG: hypothetical protein CMG41_01595 [Candidatus Marinimicrobia bacterium]|nr:hypothetical protein [Candidatus Neomarinimicrobiota bacterium]|tara:strand:+ start:249 stop:434 length:186 start_codon:yes stop_codon:yes gene_type:complete
MFNNLDNRIRYAIGIVFILGALFGGLVGYDLKSIGQQYNHIWVLSIIALYAGIDLISKAMG